MIAARPPEDDRSAALRDGGKPIGLARWSRASLRRTLVLALLGGMLVASGAALWSAWRTATRAADAAYDRSLAGAIKAIDANITTAGGAVYFRVATEDGLVEIGNTDLPPPGPDLPTGRPRFRNASYYGEPIRLGPTRAS
ncbi:MAG: sensor histidine kinase N-terminal domain-containing protein [Burkholderiaceae bacterium]